METTLGIIKPDAVSNHLAGRILAQIEANGLTVEALRMVQLSEAQAKAFYKVHASKPFYQSLVDFMTSGPCVVMILRGEGAIERYRALMGTTDPAKAAPNTIRALYGSNVEQNAVHGSDSSATAAQEVGFFRTALSRWMGV